MSALEQEVLQKLMQLDESAQQRIIQTVAATWAKPETQPDLWQTWLEETRRLRNELRIEYGGNTGIDVTALLREIRDGDDE